jgi:hypothetical protein
VDAAETAVIWVRAHVDRVNDLGEARRWAELLAHVDRQISFAEGETTGVVVAAWDRGLAGASVGDSVGWVVSDSGIDELTGSQMRKPLLGSGRAVPIGFERAGLSGTLLLATDGLVNYAKRDGIRKALSGAGELEGICRILANMVRLKSGALPDDVGVAVLRPENV